MWYIVDVKWEVEYYRDSKGNIPVQDFIRRQSDKVKAKILKFIDLLEELNLLLGQPHVKKLADSDVWELRIRHSSNYYRILYFATSGHRFILLHAFLKKTDITPKDEIRIAKARMLDYEARCNS